jgi:predicted enzyme involved in methoxymalonyl-ACP biosynthesis
MSCRVNGLDVELAALSEILAQVGDGSRTIAARLVPTRVNLLCRDIWTRCGFTQDAQNAEHWTLPSHAVPGRPAHIS